MANRQQGGKNYAGKQNQFGLKEAYSVLQRDFLELKKAYIGNEQQVVELQEQCLILQQSYQELQRNSQDQQAKLVEKLEKSYDAYNEKFMRVEELEEELNRCKTKLKEINERNENEVKAASMQQHQIDQLNFQRQILEEAVHKSLANVGLSLVAVNDHFEIKILDYKMLRQLAAYGDDCTSNSFAKDEKIVELEQANGFLQQTLLSLKDFCENQRNELSRKTNLLQEKTEECVMLNNGTGSTGEGEKGTILVKRKTFGRIVNGLSEMSDFVVELKKTISDQNSWIEILMGALDEHKKSQPSKDDPGKTINISTAKHSDTSTYAGQNYVNKSKMKTKNAGPKGKPSDNCSSAAAGKADGKQNFANKSKMSTKKSGKKGKPSDNGSSVAVGNTGGYSADKTVGLLQPSVKGGDDLELLEGFKDYVVVSSREGSAFEQVKVSDSNKHGASSLPFSSLQLDTRVPVNMEPKSLRHELYQQSRIDEAMKGWERFETHSGECLPGDIANDTSKLRKHVAATKQDMCPMCNFIFETNFDLKIRRAHINSHFKD